MGSYYDCAECTSGLRAGNDFLKTKYPPAADSKESTMIPRRASNNRLTPVYSKAREPINRLIVNPTPQSKAVP